ncbi:hypothetical protein BIY24_05350 [Halobacteriovorax marinus]|uniref:hypothetical protein n=1 Tax=Halobacteriovorax marinus TaxID=97084 RepID=UPI000BC32EB9|nr:hypothetical protein [Halobacteriovorax marinus]ATH07383.1 hypothetical protein BIY24_05350 [Halobacteriovorax marinus]
MKKISLVTFILLALSIAIYLIFGSKTKEYELTLGEKRPTPIARKTEPPKVEKKVESEEVTTKVVEEFDSAEFDKYLDEVEEGWNKSIEALFLDNSTHANRNLIEYRKLKNGYEQERERRYEEFHKMMEAKHGENYSYSPSADEEMFNEKLVKIYEGQLAKIIGDKKMIEYLRVKDEFNQKLESRALDDNSYIQIEF